MHYREKWPLIYSSWLSAFCLSIRIRGIPLRMPFLLLLLYQMTASLSDRMNHLVLPSARLTSVSVSPAYVRPHGPPVDLRGPLFPLQLFWSPSSLDEHNASLPYLARAQRERK